jgi:hypothetical protein
VESDPIQSAVQENGPATHLPAWRAHALAKLGEPLHPRVGVLNLHFNARKAPVLLHRRAYLDGALRRG